MNADQRRLKTKFLSVFIRVHPWLKLILPPPPRPQFPRLSPDVQYRQSLGPRRPRGCAPCTVEIVIAGGIATPVTVRYPQEMTARRSQMKAAVYYGPRDVRVETVPKPSAGPGEVVLRVLRCSVCGTDKRIFTHGQKNVVPPTITGHEIVGTVDEVGSGVDSAIAIGRKVVVATVVGCGKCVYCRRKQFNLCDSFTDRKSVVEGKRADL